MKRVFANFMLRLLGWKFVDPVPQGIAKAVIIVAPHTSNWDFVYGVLALLSSGVRFRFLIKKELMFFPLGLLLKTLGAIPVERNKFRKSMSHVDEVSKIINDSDSMMLIITPEGTRSYVSRWKTGFYAIAKASNVPIMIGYIDYRTKCMGIKEVFYPTGDMERDIDYIMSCYKGLSARYPEKTNI
jgi:1-acyl-sn-glycerol-3-phosphate acyltransferase